LCFLRDYFNAVGTDAKLPVCIMLKFYLCDDVQMKIQVLNSAGKNVIFFVLENIEEKMLLGEMNKKLNFSSMLICSLSHELQTPVHHLLSGAESLGLYFESAAITPSSKTLKAKGDSSLMLKSCLGLSIFIQNLLDFARYFNNCLKANTEEFNVETALNEVMTIFSIKTAKKKLKLSIECQKDIMIFSDRTEVHRDNLHLP
jgi:K+-sensing histidine kinase KdpD